MRTTCVRFTIRRMMAVVVIIAILLAIAHQVIRYRQAQLQRELLQAKIAMNQLAQAEVKMRTEATEDLRVSPEEMKALERSLAELRWEGDALRLRLSQLQP